MQVGISTACFYEREHVEDTFSIIRESGAEVVEVFLNTFSEYEHAFVERLSALRTGLKVHSIHAHGTCFEPELFCDYDRVRLDAENIFKKVCSAGFNLGAKYYTFHGQFNKAAREETVDFEKFGEKMNRLIDIAGNYGIQIAYENVNWCRFNTPEFFKNLKAVCPGLKATFDIKQAIYSDIDPYRFLDAMGDRLVTAHICGMERGNVPVLPPAGRINYEKLMRYIYDINPETNVFLEVYSGCYRDYDELKDSFLFLRALADNLG